MQSCPPHLHRQPLQQWVAEVCAAPLLLSKRVEVHKHLHQSLPARLQAGRNETGIMSGAWLRHQLAHTLRLHNNSSTTGQAGRGQEEQEPPVQVAHLQKLLKPGGVAVRPGIKVRSLVLPGQVAGDGGRLQLAGLGAQQGAGAGQEAGECRGSAVVRWQPCRCPLCACGG